MNFYCSNDLARLLKVKLKPTILQPSVSPIGDWYCSTISLSSVDKPEGTTCIIAVNTKTLYSFIFPQCFLEEFPSFNECFTFHLWTTLEQEIDIQHYLRVLGPDILTSDFISLNNPRVWGKPNAIKRFYSEMQTTDDDNPAPITLQQLAMLVNGRPMKVLGHKMPYELLGELIGSGNEVQLLQ